MDPQASSQRSPEATSANDEQIRRLARGSYPAYTQVFGVLFTSLPERRAVLGELLANRQSIARTFAYFNKGEVIGGLVFGDTDIYTAELAAAALLPEYRNQGRGKQLLQTFEEDAAERGIKAVQLWAPNRDPSINWFKDRGYSKINLNYVPNGCVRMGKVL